MQYLKGNKIRINLFMGLKQLYIKCFKSKNHFYIDL